MILGDFCVEIEGLSYSSLSNSFECVTDEVVDNWRTTHLENLHNEHGSVAADC